MTPAQAAVHYVLRRIVDDVDIGFRLGAMTEAYHLLCMAEADRLGKDAEEVESATWARYTERQRGVLCTRHRLALLREAVEAEVTHETWRRIEEQWEALCVEQSGGER